MRILTLVLLICSLVPLGACRRPSKPPAAAVVNSMNPGDFLTKTGKTRYTEYQLETELTLSPSPPASIRWQILRTMDAGTSIPKPMGGPGGGLQLATPTAGWFVYMEDDKNFWFFNGSDSLSKSSMNGGPHVAIHEGKIYDNITPPPEVILRLPLELQKLYPPVQPKTKPPSI